jgi:hypothetical protein
MIAALNPITPPSPASADAEGQRSPSKSSVSVGSICERSAHACMQSSLTK